MGEIDLANTVMFRSPAPECIPNKADAEAVMVTQKFRIMKSRKLFELARSDCAEAGLL